jgi:hypothetical protein
LSFLAHPITTAFMTPTETLRAIAARADAEHVATLTAPEFEFAMTLAGRRWLECIQLGGHEFRLSAAARKLLAEDPPSDAH